MESIETLNSRLEDYFGLDTDTNRPIWRIVWSDSQYEKQLLTRTPEGFQLLYPEWFEVPKYKMIGIRSRFVLERLVIVPAVNAHELTTKLSYEPMWVFEDKLGNSVPPKWEPIKHIVDCIYLAIGKYNTGQVQYPDPDAKLTTQEVIEKESARIKQMQEDLFGNETDTGDALAHGEGVTVPGGN